MVGIIIIIAPLLIYFLGAITIDREEVKHPDEYFSAFRKVGKTEFASSSIAYGFQVSTIYPFLFWGASSFLFIPFINALCWGLGIILFYFSIEKIKKYLGSNYTLHGFIGETYGDINRKIASIITIIGFLGFLIAELWFGSRVLLAIVPSSNWLYLILFLFLIFIAGYLFLGGQLSSFRTDQLQLSITYIGIFGVIAYLLYLTIRNQVEIVPGLSWGVIILCNLIPVILSVRKFSFILIDDLWDKFLNTLVSFLFLIILSLSLYILFYSPTKFEFQNFVNLEGFGISGLLALIILPLGWQFVDLSNWQRLLGVKENNKIDSNSDLKDGLFTYAIESPFTWILFILFGLLAANAFPNFSFDEVIIDFPNELINSGILIDQVAGYIFIVSIISIMLSTVDSFMMAIGFTYTYDLNSFARKILENRNEKELRNNLNQIISKGKFFSFLIVLLGLVLFVFFDLAIEGGGQLFINLLLTFYSASLAFLPLILGKLFLKTPPSKNIAALSMVLGAITGISIGIYSVIWNPYFAWFPVIVSTLISSIIFSIGIIMPVEKNGTY